MEMRKVLTVLSAVCLLGVFSLFAEYQVGDTVADFILQGYVDGDFSETQSVSLYDNYISQGKAVVLDFFFTTCGECNEHVADYVEMYNTYHETKDFAIVFVDVVAAEPGSVIETWANTHNVTGIGDVLKAGQTVLARFSSVASTPYCALIDKNGVLRYKASLLNDTVTAAFFSNSNWVDIDENIAPEFAVNNYPNPFNPNTTIELTLSKRENVEVTIYNVLGKEVKSLVKGTLDEGKHSFQWNGTDNSNDSLPSGIYFYKITTDSRSIFKKMLLVK